jgi:hypothetical protein
MRKIPKISRAVDFIELNFVLVFSLFFFKHSLSYILFFCESLSGRCHRYRDRAYFSAVS